MASLRGTAAAFVVVVALGLPWAAATPVDSAPAMAVESTQALDRPLEYYFTVGNSVRLLGAVANESAGEPLVDASGNLVLSYTNASYPYFARFRGGGPELITGPVNMSAPWQGASRAADYWPPGPTATIDAQQRLAQVYYSRPGTTPVDTSYKLFALSGTEVRGQTHIGNASVVAAQPVVAAGPSGGLRFLYTVSNDPMGTGDRVLFDAVSDNGTVDTAGSLLFSNGTSYNIGTHIAPDAPRNRTIVMWKNIIDQKARVVALSADGAAVWAPVELGPVAYPGSLAVAGDGSVVVVWNSDTALYAAKIGSDGALLEPGRAVLTGLTLARVPRVYEAPTGDFVLLWRDHSSGPSRARILVLDASGLGPLAEPFNVTGTNSRAGEPRGVFAPDGTFWVTWTNYSTIPLADIWLTPFSIGRSGFRVEAPTTEATVYRGEPFEMNLTLLSRGAPARTYSLEPQSNPLSWPDNWSVEVVEPSTGLPVTSIRLDENATAPLMLRVAPPVVDLPSYSSWVGLKVEDTLRPSVNGTLLVNVTVVPGRSYRVTPADLSASVLPGASANLTYTVANNGSLAEAGLSVVLTAPPPPGWQASLTPSSFTAGPGESSALTVTVAVPADALGGSAYCARVLVASDRDPFARASAGFCVETALVVQPSVGPENRSEAMEPGATLTLNWTLGHTGNAGSPIPCTLTLAESLPLGWWSIGSPVAVELGRDAYVSVSVGFVAPTDALGGTELPLTLRAACDGSDSVATASLTIRVNDLHRLSWFVGGSVVDADASGLATASVRVENQGNVPEVLAVVAGALPSAWSAAGNLSVEGVVTNTLPPFSIGRLDLAAQAPPNALAGNYLVSFEVSTEQGAAFAVPLTVRVAPHFGLQAALAQGPYDLPVGGSVLLEVAVEHLGNVNDSFAYSVAVEATGAWRWTAEYLPDAPSDTSALGNMSLRLAPFSVGVLRILVSAPSALLSADATLSIRLSGSHIVAAVLAADLHALIPDLRVSLGDLPSGTADPVLVASVHVQVDLAGEGSVENATLRVILDGRTVLLEDLGLLAQGATVHRSVALELGEGEHRLLVAIDPRDVQGANSAYGRVFEVNETNNELSRTFSVPGPTPAPPPPPPTGDPAVAGPGLSGGALAAIALVAAGAGLALFLLVRRRRTRGE